MRETGRAIDKLSCYQQTTANSIRTYKTSSPNHGKSQTANIWKVMTRNQDDKTYSKITTVQWVHVYTDHYINTGKFTITHYWVCHSPVSPAGEEDYSFQLLVVQKVVKWPNAALFPEWIRDQIRIVAVKWDIHFITDLCLLIYSLEECKTKFHIQKLTVQLQMTCRISDVC